MLHPSGYLQTIRSHLLIPRIAQSTLQSNPRPWCMVKAARQFDVLVATLPVSEGGEEAQLKQIAELQAENDAIGQQLHRQLEAAEEELKQVQELLNQAADNYLNLKKPD